MVTFVVVLGGWGLAAMSLYLVRTPDGFQLLTKNRLTITDTWLDTRQWTLVDIDKHPAFAQRVVELKKASLLRHVTDVEGSQDLDDHLQKAAEASLAQQDIDWPSLLLRFLPK